MSAAFSLLENLQEPHPENRFSRTPSEEPFLQNTFFRTASQEPLLQSTFIRTPCSAPTPYYEHLLKNAFLRTSSQEPLLRNPFSITPSSELAPCISTPSSEPFLQNSVPPVRCLQGLAPLPARPSSWIQENLISTPSSAVPPGGWSLTPAGRGLTPGGRGRSRPGVITRCGGSRLPVCQRRPEPRPLRSYGRRRSGRHGYRC